MLIRFDEVSRVYKMGSEEIMALDHISFEIEKNEFTAIMGPSGSGKSTIMNIIGCLHKPSYGNYSLEGINIMTLNDHQLSQIRNQKIGFVFQSFNLLPRLSALKNTELPLIYGGYPKSQRIELARVMLKSLGLKDRMYHRPYELSGGQQQRVAIARALVTNPSVLLADEPTGNLDSKTGKEVLEIFFELKDQGKTIICVTHDEDIVRYTDRIIRVKDGRIVSDVKSH